MKKYSRKYSFTLVELLVSLGVFSILLVLFMQFFSGMRLTWTNTEKRGDVSSDARIAMNMLSTLIGATYYSTASLAPGEIGHFPYQIDPLTSRPGKMYFAVKTNVDLPGSNPIRFIGVQLPNATEPFGLTAASPYNRDTDPFYKLYLTVLSNDNSTGNGDVFSRYFPEFLNSSGNTVAASAALGDLRTNLNGKLSTVSNHRIELMKNVTDFRIRAYDYSGNLLPTTGDIFCVPAAVEIELSVLRDEDFTAWITMKGGSATGTETAAARNHRLQKQLTFMRRIYIGDRWKVEAGYDQY